jgi:polygalacturonase
MDRRKFLTGTVVAAALPKKVQVTRDDAVNVITKFGFVADGRTCNYDAFLRLAAAASANGGGRYRFPPGEYYVARYRTLKPISAPNIRPTRRAM